MQRSDIVTNIQQKYRDADLLIQHQRYANAIYLCGYCIELALKYAIAVRLNWQGYRTDGKLKILKTHDLDILAALTGQENEIKRRLSWSTAIKWDETRRYEDPNLAKKDDALAMLRAAKEFVEMLCEISL